jgi:hypothetical protein
MHLVCMPMGTAASDVTLARLEAQWCLWFDEQHTLQAAAVPNPRCPRCPHCLSSSVGRRHALAMLDGDGFTLIANRFSDWDTNATHSLVFSRLPPRLSCLPPFTYPAKQPQQFRLSNRGWLRKDMQPQSLLHAAVLASYMLPVICIQGLRKSHHR